MRRFARYGQVYRDAPHSELEEFTKDKEQSPRSSADTSFTNVLLFPGRHGEELHCFGAVCVVRTRHEQPDPTVAVYLGDRPPAVPPCCRRSERATAVSGWSAVASVISIGHTGGERPRRRHNG